MLRPNNIKAVLGMVGTFKKERRLLLLIICVMLEGRELDREEVEEEDEEGQQSGESEIGGRVAPGEER